MKETFFCSWSGGKDSALSLYKALQSNGEAKKLLTMFGETKSRSRSHNLPLSLIKAQSISLGIPMITKKASWQNYEKVFIRTLKEFKDSGIDKGVFGDIDINEHKEWEEQVCKKAGIKACLPLWGNDREKLLHDFLNLGFRAVIVVVNEDYLDKRYLGKVLDKALIKEFKSKGVDPNGEKGEYHSFVIDGPIFNKKINISCEDKIYHAGYWFQDVKLIKSK